MNLRCIVVDDEPMARKGIEEYIGDISYLTHMGSFESAAEAGTFLSSQSVDLMLLDIRMPKLSGIDFLKTLKEPPLIIFTTAFPDYALESYELSVLDYLVKPISFERFKKATQRALDYFLLKQPQTVPNYFFIKCNQKLEKVLFNEVLFVEAMQNYCIIHTDSRNLICYITLTAMNEKLPTDHFMKVHKSFIVALQKINAIKGDKIAIGAALVPISRNLRNEVMSRIVRNNLLRNH
jgi:DNA-binding LytR/AlgR family response regulator